ncbi:serine protease [Actinokineospora sp. NBRC 105648]|uniref:S1 family peptidase n=1 Tax=Actinokineospora sp. NBRC 105648 TaxID=3032206 RepID=UPI0024A13FE0|nr:serine protease [Actinokineospora sp. NBRC 105648]GLZ40696.1 serine protease [Actinokineospora sp. NBRC 105648]
MTASQGTVEHSGRERWRVRVRSRSHPARVLGAGVLVDSTHVLTCAHVVLGVDDLAVDLVELPGRPSSRARVIKNLCVPPMDDERGDVALLELLSPQPADCAARLRRVALTWDRRVHTLGYPTGEGLDIGEWTRMTLAGHAGAEWLQMNRSSVNDTRVRSGFSGAGVADDATGDVLGIVVSEYTDATAGLSWMLPVEAIVRHLPIVSEWVVGDSGIDPSFAPTAVGPELLGEAERLVDWIERRHDGPAVLIVLRRDIAAVRQAVAVSSGRVDAGDARTLGGVDLALDVGGRTVDEVSRRIVERAGLAAEGADTASDRLRAGTPPMTIVLDGVDEAEQPVALLDEVLKPMVDSGARLVLGFRHDESASLASARDLRGELVTGRLAAIAKRVEALPDDTDWQLRLTALRKAAARDAGAVAGVLPKMEERLRRDERRERRRHRVDESTSIDRGVLVATQARANDQGLGEDIGLAAAYRRADELLAAEPVDQAAAHAAVLAYEAAVRQALANRGHR